MTEPLPELVEQVCVFRRNQRGKTDGAVTTSRRKLGQFLAFVRTREGWHARVRDLTAATIQTWIDDVPRPTSS